MAAYVHQAPMPLRAEVIGHTVRGRPITAWQVGDPAAPVRVLAVGSVHGTEPGGIAVARTLRGMQPPAGVQLWVIDDLNPDGHAAGTRGNARGVDLNRNFPFRWSPRADEWNPGRRRLSEPESRAAWSLVQRVRPQVSVWFHQAARRVDLSGGDPMVQWRYGHRVGLPVSRMRRYPGSATGTQDHWFPGTTAFVVELAGGRPPGSVVHRHASAVLAAGADLVPLPPAPQPPPPEAAPAAPDTVG